MSNEPESKTYLKLNDIEAYKVAFKLSNRVWDIVLQWEHFVRSTIGNQFVRSVDSISANIAEGFGRHGKKRKSSFFRYARGSIYESLDWCEKAHKRELLTEDDYQHIMQDLFELPRSINTLIRYTRENLKE